MIRHIVRGTAGFAYSVLSVVALNACSNSAGTVGAEESTATSRASVTQICPSVGADSDCGEIITITNTGATALPTGQGPYDQIEDTLVGVVNNSNIAISSLILSSNLPIFGFDGDGIDTYGISGNAMDSTGYGGPNTYFSDYSANRTMGTVHFIKPLAPNGGSTFFSLEEAIGSATACSTIINKSIKRQASGKNICATFTPNQASGAPPAPGMPGYTLAQAAQLCGFKNFNWVQQKTVQFDPSPFYARNLNGAYDSSIGGFVRLTSKRAPYDDPPKGGGYAPGAGGGATPDNSYPFYYDTALELPAHEDGTIGPGTATPACALTATAGSTLTFHDAPSNSCLPGGAGAGTPPCTDAILAPGATTEPKGSFGAFVTHLAGINFDGTATDLQIGFTWTTDNNGTTGGVTINKTDLPADGNGTGGVTITSITDITNFGGLTVVGVNGSSSGAPAVLAFGNACDGAFGGTFNGDVTVSSGQNCAFSGGYIAGNVRMSGGTLALSGVLVGGDIQITGGTFSIGPTAVVNGNLEVHDMMNADSSQVCGSTVYGNVEIHNNAGAIQFGAVDQTLCLGAFIGGNVEIHNNTGVTGLFGNTVSGNVEDHNNKALTQVFGNVVSRNLHCVNNASIAGGGNTAAKKQGECANL